MADPTERYRDTYDEFSSLLSHAIQLVEAQAGTTAADDRHLFAERIFSKLVCHGISLKRLSPSPDPTGQSELWDLSSNYAIARTLIETYEALAYVALEEVSEEERDFRIVLWKLHAEERRSEMLRLIGSKNPAVHAVVDKMHTLRAEALAHPFMTGASTDLKRKVSRGETPPYHLSRAERDARSGIDHEYHKGVVMHLSSHVHTHPFSVYQLFSFQAGEPECLRLMSIPLQYSASFLSKALIGMIQLFSPRVPVAPAALTRALEVWENLLASGVKNAGYSGKGK